MWLAAIPAQINVDWIEVWTRMGWLDIVFVAAFIFGTFLGLRNGLARVFPGLFEVLAAQWVTLEYGQGFSDFLARKVPLSGFILHALVFAGLAIATILIMRFTFQLLSILVAVEFKPPLNGVGGALLGGLQFVLYLSLIAGFLTLFPLPFIQDTFSGRTISGPYLVESNQIVHDTFSNWIPKAWRES